MEELVEYEIARIIKEKGFNERCTHFYILNFSNFKPNFTPIKNGLPDCCNSENILQSVSRGKGQPHLAGAPTQSQLQTWLRNKFGINIQIEPSYNNYRIRKITKFDGNSNIDFKGVSNKDYSTFEECLEVGLLFSSKVI